MDKATNKGLTLQPIQVEGYLKKNKLMVKKKTHGGARKNAGRKPVEDKKQQVNLYIEGSLIEQHGGKTEIQQKCYAFLREDKKEMK